MATKLSAQVVITPMLLAAIENAIEAMKYYGNSADMVAAAKKDDKVGEVIRAAITNTSYSRAILKKFLQECKDMLDEQ